jgi:hypothetical protein
MGSEKSAYYTFEFKKDSDEWNRTKKLFNEYVVLSFILIYLYIFVDFLFN